MRITRHQLRRLLIESMTYDNLDQINKLITLIMSGDPALIRSGLSLAQSQDHISDVREDISLLYSNNSDINIQKNGFKTVTVVFESTLQFGDALGDAYYHTSNWKAFSSGLEARGEPKDYIYDLGILPKNQRYQIRFSFDDSYDLNLS